MQVLSKDWWLDWKHMMSQHLIYGHCRMVTKHAGDSDSVIIWGQSISSVTLRYFRRMKIIKKSPSRFCFSQAMHTMSRKCLHSSTCHRNICDDFVRLDRCPIIAWPPYFKIAAHVQTDFAMVLKAPVRVLPWYTAPYLVGFIRVRFSTTMTTSFFLKRSNNCGSHFAPVSLWQQVTQLTICMNH